MLEKQEEIPIHQRSVEEVANGILKNFQPIRDLHNAGEISEENLDFIAVSIQLAYKLASLGETQGALGILEKAGIVPSFAESIESI